MADLFPEHYLATAVIMAILRPDTGRLHFVLRDHPLRLMLFGSTKISIKLPKIIRTIHRHTTYLPAADGIGVVALAEPLRAFAACRTTHT